ncbi:uncharacterized protein LOC116254525 [Nymphaea colorata]|nr:uncharacterized protein LOC116254525 [Nymphaea colorata]
MSQFLLVAAAATTGYFAKRIIDAFTDSRTHDLRRHQQLSDDISDSDVQDLPPQSSCEVIQPHKDHHGLDTLDVHRSKKAETDDGVFRFSSVRVGSTRTGHAAARSGPGRRRSGAPKRKRMSLRLKKQKHSKGCLGRERRDPGLVSSSSFSQEDHLFSWGISMGAMLMASVGKHEMDKLSVALDETGKLIHELKTELHTRKSMRSSNPLSGKCPVIPCKEESFECAVIPCKAEGLATEKHMMHEEFHEEEKYLDPGIASTPAQDGSGDYASSVVTEESPQRTLEMRDLEAELESELEKISWSLAHESSQPVKGLSKLNLMDPIVVLNSNNEVTHVHPHPGSHEHRHGISILDLEHELRNLSMEHQETHIQKSNLTPQSTLASIHSEIGDDELSGDSATSGAVKDEAWEEEQNCYTILKKVKPVNQEFPTLRKKRTFEAELPCHCPLNASYNAYVCQ